MSDNLENPGDFMVRTSRGSGTLVGSKGAGRMITKEVDGHKIQVNTKTALIRTPAASPNLPGTDMPRFRSGFYSVLVPIVVTDNGGIDLERSHPLVREALEKKGYEIKLNPTDSDMDEIAYDESWSDESLKNNEIVDYRGFSEPGERQTIKRRAQLVLKRKKDEAELAALSSIAETEAEALRNSSRSRKVRDITDPVYIKRREQAQHMRKVRAEKLKKTKGGVKPNVTPDVNDTSPAQDSA